MPLHKQIRAEKGLTNRWSGKKYLLLIALVLFVAAQLNRWAAEVICWDFKKRLLVEVKLQIVASKIYGI